MLAVEVQNCTKSFGHIVAVNNVTFSVNEGEVYGILGPNGAGKTTTLKLLMGLLKPDSGSGSILGLDCSQDSIEIKKLVGYVPEEPLLYDSLTPRELFEFIASMRELPHYETANKVKKMTRALGLENYFDQIILTLSQGNRQKVLLISALLHSPRLLILDEPFSGLDVRSVRIMKDIITIHKENGGAVLLSTHIMEVAQGLCDRIGILNRGKLIAEGSLDELRTQAEQEGATLEQLFLRLTNQDEDVAHGVDILREALSE